MKYVLTIDSNTKLLTGYSEVSTDNEADIVSVVGVNEVYILANRLVDPVNFLNSNYFNGTDIVTLPAKVEEYYIWDSINFIYREPDGYLEIVKQNKTNALNNLRAYKNTQSITYLGIAFDADIISQTNISGKILEITTKQVLGIIDTNFFWKDTANVIHTWATMEEYLLWLRGLAIAIAERTTLLYAKAWAKKEEVQALATVNEVLSYEIDAAW
jgi:hypothetical protein